MRWYEYKMEADDLHAPEHLKAKLLAMADTLPEEEKNRPMMPAQTDNTAVVRPQEPPKKAKLIHFPAKPVGALAPVWPCAWWATTCWAPECWTSVQRAATWLCIRPIVPQLPPQVALPPSRPCWTPRKRLPTVWTPVRRTA